MSSKVYADAAAALHDVFDGAVVMGGGFGLCANAENCIRELARRGNRNLTVVSNNCGNQGRGLAVLLKQKQVRKVVASFIGGNPDLQAQLLAGEIEVELTPQGTLAERIRAAGAGIPAFFTPTGAGTLAAEGKETREFDGRTYLMERALHGDYAIIRAWQGDAFGNLRFRGTGRNFSPLMAMAAKVTVAEVDELVPIGALGPDDVHLPGIFVQRVFQGRDYENPIEHRTTRPRPAAV